MTATELIKNPPAENQPIALPERRSNRPITLQYRMEYYAALMLLGFFRLVGVDLSSALAGRFLRFVGPLAGAVSRRAERNLKLVFPDWAEDKIKATVKDIWENLGRTAAEFAHLEKFHPFTPDSRVSVSGAEKLFEIANTGKPAIFVSGHLANWEVMSIVFHAAGLKYGVVYRAANNPLVDELIIKRRGDVMSRLQIPKGKRGGRMLLETIKSGRSVAMLVDQKLNDGISAPFLGHDAMTAPAAARLSLRFDAPIIPVGIERLNGAYFHVSVGDEITFKPCGDLTKDVLDLTVRVNEEVGRLIKANPGQWLWLHRRWPKSMYA